MDKAVIMAAGLGTRMRRGGDTAGLTAAQAAMADTGIKALVSVGRPFLDYVLNALANAGYGRVCLVIGPDHEQLRQYYGRQLCYERLQVEFAVQQKALGTADAVAAAACFAADDPFLVINSDNYYPVEALRALRLLDGPGLAPFERQGMLEGSNIPAERLASFAVVEADEEGYLRRIVEKPTPAEVEGRYAGAGISMNCWRFDRRIFTACAAIEPSARGELELPDAVQHAADRLGVRFRVLPQRQAVLDLSSREDIEPVKARLEGVEVRL